MGTLNVLEAVRASPSVEPWSRITSERRTATTNGWGYVKPTIWAADPKASKGCAEIIALPGFKSFFGDPVTTPYCATTRAGNVIGEEHAGGGPHRARLRPRGASEQEVEIRSPHARPWQHVLEPLGYLCRKLSTAHRDAVNGGAATAAAEGFRLDGEAFNFGPSSDASHNRSRRGPVAGKPVVRVSSKMDLAG